jgi:small GTP-binding protein
MYDYLAKIIFIGDSNIGKSCLLFRIADKQWCNDTEATIGVEFRSITLTSKRGSVFKLQLWDTSGQEKFHSIVRSYYRQGHGCLLVFDITNYDSFRNLEYWFQEIQNHSNNISTKNIILIGTKSDLSKNRVVTMDQINEFVQTHNLLDYVETSAKTGENIDKILPLLIESNLLNLPCNTIVTEFNVEEKSSCCLIN